MNDFLPILSGLAGGAMQGLADKRSREIKAATLERQRQADAATKAYREQMLQLGKDRLTASGKDDERAVYNKELERVMNTAKFFGNQAQGAIRDLYNPSIVSRGGFLGGLNDLRLTSQTKINSLIAPLVKLGMTPQEAVGAITPFVPSELLPDIDASGNMTYKPLNVDRVPLPVIAPIEKGYDELQKAVSNLTPEEQQAYLAGPANTAFREKAERGIGIDEAKARFPMAYPVSTQMPIIAPMFAPQGVANPAAQEIFNAPLQDASSIVDFIRSNDPEAYASGDIFFPQTIISKVRNNAINDIASQIFETNPAYLTPEQVNSAREFATNLNLKNPDHRAMLSKIRPGTLGYNMMTSAMTGGTEKVGETPVDIYPAPLADPTELAKRRLLGTNANIAEQRLREMPIRMQIAERMANLKEAVARWSSDFKERGFTYKKGQDDFMNEMRRQVFNLNVNKFNVDNVKNIADLSSKEMGDAQTEVNSAGMALGSFTKGAQLMAAIADNPEVRAIVDKVARGVRLTSVEETKLRDAGATDLRLQGAAMVRYSQALARKARAISFFDQAQSLHRQTVAPGFVPSAVSAPVGYGDPLAWLGGTGGPTVIPASPSVTTPAASPFTGMPPSGSGGLGRGRP